MKVHALNYKLFFHLVKYVFWSSHHKILGYIYGEVHETSTRVSIPH